MPLKSKGFSQLNFVRIPTSDKTLAQARTAVINALNSNTAINSSKYWFASLAFDDGVNPVTIDYIWSDELVTDAGLSSNFSVALDKETLEKLANVDNSIATAISDAMNTTIKTDQTTSPVNAGNKLVAQADLIWDNVGDKPTNFLFDTDTQSVVSPSNKLATMSDVATASGQAAVGWKAVYDTNDNGKVDVAEFADQAGNASTVSGFTVGSAVPANAEFTDTVYNDADVLKDSDTQSPVTAGNKLVTMSEIADFLDITSSSRVVQGSMDLVGTMQVGGDLTVTGNLTVNGTNTVVNSETVTTSDNLIVLNNGEQGSGVTAGRAGIQVDRGSSTTYEIVFDETEDMFKVGMEGDLETIASQDYVDQQLSSSESDADSKYLRKDVNSSHDATLSVNKQVIRDEIRLEGAAGTNALIQKNASAGRDELQIYAGGDAYASNSKGAGIHLYGNTDAEHPGALALLTGLPDQGDARLIISGRDDKTRVTIGNGIWGFVDNGEDVGMLNIKGVDGNPGIYIHGASGTEGEVAVPTGEGLSLGQYDETNGYRGIIEFTGDKIVDLKGNTRVRGSLIASYDNVNQVELIYNTVVFRNSTGNARINYSDSSDVLYFENAESYRFDDDVYIDGHKVVHENNINDTIGTFADYEAAFDAELNS